MLAGAVGTRRTFRRLRVCPVGKERRTMPMPVQGISWPLAESWLSWGRSRYMRSVNQRGSLNVCSLQPESAIILCLVNWAVDGDIAAPANETPVNEFIIPSVPGSGDCCIMAGVDDDDFVFGVEVDARLALVGFEFDDEDDIDDDVDERRRLAHSGRL